MATEVVMPQLGEGVVEGLISRWLKDVGDTVEEYEPLLEVASDKVDTEIPSPAGGTVLKLLVDEGETIDVGTVIAVIGEAGEQPSQPEEPEPVPAVVSAATSSTTSSGGNGHGSNGIEPGGRGGNRISPVVARIAGEHQVNISEVEGTGRYGRVTKKDILAYVEQREAAPAQHEPAKAEPKPAPKVAQPQPVPQAMPPPTDHVHKAPLTEAKPGDVVELNRMRKAIAEHMVESKLKTAPHVTTVFEADLSAVVAHRKANKPEFAQRGINLTFTAYFMYAAAQALRKHPMVNSRWTDDGIYLFPEVNIGMATALDDGLIVPVIKNVDELSLAGIARRVNDMATRARKGQLKGDDIQGGTFTITNHGVSGSLFATPIINQPQTGILGVGAMVKRVVVLDDDTMGIRPMIYLTLTFDHRVLDGAGADWFMVEVKSILENWQ